MKYKCIEPFDVERYSDDGFPDGEFMEIPEGSVWELDESPCITLIGGDNHLDNEATLEWIEVSNERLKKCFREENDNE